jgi:signal transduction histidine kinase
MTNSIHDVAVPWLSKVWGRLVDRDVPNNRRDAMLNDRVTLLYRQGPVGVIVHTIVISVLTYLFWDTVQHAALLIWATAMILLGWLRGGAIYLFHKLSPPPESASLWGTLFILLITLVGVTWGYAGVFLVPDTALEQVLFILFLSGTAAGTVATLASAFFAIVIALSTSVIPLIIRLASEGDFEQQLMSGALVMFFMAMMATARNASGMMTMALSLRLDKTELVASLERERHELDISNRAKTRFLAAASHDLRQPLHAMNLTVAAYRLKEKSNHLEPMFDRVERSVQAMEGLVNSLLDISKLDAGTVEVNPTSVAIDDIFIAISSEASTMAAEVDSTVFTVPSDITLHTDRTLLESILRNLVGNAIRHAPGSSIEMSAQRGGGDGVVLTVADNGPGIRADQQERVFEEFYQAQGTSKDQRGLGLGLAIVKRLSVLLGGEIKLSSTYGEGARFDLTLTDHGAVAKTEILVASRSTDVPALNGLRVVLLEDDKDSRVALLELVSVWDCEAIAGKSAEEILGNVLVADGVFTPEVIISDFQLGRSREGPTEIGEIRRLLGHPTLPAILLTGDSSPELLRRIAEGQLDVLHKPIAPDVLAAFLSTIRK